MTEAKRKRLATGLTMREYCLRNGIDPTAQSRLERGVTGPLTDEQLLGKLPPPWRVPKGCDIDGIIEAVRNA